MSRERRIRQLEFNIPDSFVLKRDKPAPKVLGSGIFAVSANVCGGGGVG